jgi:hypothetical protein
MSNTHCLDIIEAPLKSVLITKSARFRFSSSGICLLSIMFAIIKQLSLLWPTHKSLIKAKNGTTRKLITAE